MRIDNKRRHQSAAPGATSDAVWLSLASSTVLAAITLAVVLALPRFMR
jgi:hypothetical protein